MGFLRARVCVCMYVGGGGGEGVNKDNKFKSSRTFHKFQTFSLMYYNIFLVSCYNSCLVIVVVTVVVIIDVTRRRLLKLDNLWPVNVYTPCNKICFNQSF